MHHKRINTERTSEIIQRIKLSNQTQMNQRFYAGLSFTNNFKDASIQKAQTKPRELCVPENSSLSSSFLPQSTCLWSKVLEEVK